MSYLTATRYGLTKIDKRDQALSAWSAEWKHPSGMLAVKHPCDGAWYIAELGRNAGWVVGEGWSSSLLAAARKIERLLRQRA